MREHVEKIIRTPVMMFKNKRRQFQHQQESQYIRAFRNASFNVKHGKAVGIIGPNGAGRSALLRVLARVTRPTEGYADIYGSTGCMLEVGTGFHPELTGRENIFLSGAILGMRKISLKKKFADIVSFAGMEKFIDTPVKRCSNGMRVRLAFAITAQIEPDILLLDKVLVVGDQDFQKRCMSTPKKMVNDGRTILVVSHNTNFIRNLCPRSILLRDGRPNGTNRLWRLSNRIPPKTTRNRRHTS